MTATPQSVREMSRQSGRVGTPVLIAVGGVLVLTAVAVLMLGGDDAASTDGEPQPTANEQLAIDRIVQDLRAGRVDEAENLYSGSLDPQRLSATVVHRMLDGLQFGQQQEFTKSGLMLYAQMLTDVARYGVRMEPASFLAHARRLRHQAISRGDPEDVFFPVVYRLMEYPELVDRFPPMRVYLVDFNVLFGDYVPRGTDEAVDMRTRWDHALDHLPALIDEQRIDPSPNLDERYHPLRTLARVYSRHPTDRARAIFKDALGRLGDGSAADAERFDRWYQRAFSVEDEEPWSIDDPSLCYGYDAEIASQLRNWLFGIARLYRRGDGLDRGSDRIERSLKGVDFGPHYLFKLDLALALRDEANRLEEMLVDETSVSGRDRGRQLYEIGWEAIRRGDRQELDEVLVRLEDSALPEIEHLRELLRGAREMLGGEDDAGRRRIRGRLDAEYELLADEEVATWRAIANNGPLPTVGDQHRGHSLLTSGVLWDDLRESDLLERVVRQLEGHLSRPDDLYYMRYLEALLAYRRSEVDGLAERMFDLLDLESPPGISRAEVAGLTAAIDTRVQDIEALRERRRRALKDLIPDVLRGVPDRSSVIQIAEIADWQLRMDRSQGDYLHSEDGRTALSEIMAGLETDAGLDFRLEEKWIELEQQLLALTRHYREEGEVDLARETLAHSNLLGEDHPQYRGEEARLLELEAERIPRAQPEERAAAWLAVAEAYRDAARTQFGNPELFYEAAQAYLEAGELIEAKNVLASYMPNRGDGARGEQRYWGRIIARSEIARRSGLPDNAIEILDDITDFQGAETYRARLALERAWALRDRGDREEALAIFDRILLESADPLSQESIHALYGRASVLQERHGGIYADPNHTEEQRRAALREAHVVWEDLSHKIDAKSGDVRLAEALYLAGVGWIERDDLDAARRYLARLQPAAEQAAAHDLTPEDRDAWESYAARAAHAHAEAYFLEDRYSDAIQMYNAAIAENPDSPEIALAYHQLGLCWFRLNDFAEARRYWELGRSRVDALAEEHLDRLPLQQDKTFWLALYDEKLDALDNPDRLRSP